MKNLFRRSEPEPPPRLDPATLVVCIEDFRPQAITRTVERGEWRRLDSPLVAAHPARFAARLIDLDLEEHNAA